MLGTKPTGNGRRQAYDHKTYTRMTNTFFEPGKDKLKDMIKSIEDGYLIDVTNNGMEDPKTGKSNVLLLLVEKSKMEN